MSILDALNKAKEQKQQEQVEFAGKVELPEIGYWKFINGVDSKDGEYIGKDQFKWTLKSLGIGKEVIEELLDEDVRNREWFLDYFESIIKDAYEFNNRQLS